MVVTVRSLIPNFPLSESERVDESSFIGSLEFIKERLKFDSAKDFFSFYTKEFSSESEGRMDLSLASLGLTYMGLLNLLSKEEIKTWYQLCDHRRLLPYLYKGPYEAPDGSKVFMYYDFKDSAEVSKEGDCDERTIGICFAIFDRTSSTVRHRGKVLCEKWYILGGEADVLIRTEMGERFFKVREGSSFSVIGGQHFQISPTSPLPVKVAILDYPKWPGQDEGIAVPDHWRVEKTSQLSFEAERLFSIIREGNLDQLGDYVSKNIEALRSEVVIKQLIKYLFVLGGKISLDLDPLIIEALFVEGYINKEGYIQEPFRLLMRNSAGNKKKAIESMRLPSALVSKKEILFELLENHLDYKERAFASYTLFLLRREKVTIPDAYFPLISAAMDEIDHVATASGDKDAPVCNAKIKILGTYKKGGSTFGIDYAIVEREKTSRTVIRPLDEWYLVVDGVVRVYIGDESPVVAGRGEVVFLPKEHKLKFKAEGPTTLKLMVFTEPAFESVNPASFQVLDESHL